MKKIKLGLIGAGERGADCYAPYALKYPAEAEFTCVAEPVEERRNRFSKLHNIGKDMQFCSWEEMLESPLDADGIIISTQDRQHYMPAMKAIEKGYALLLEKPMAESIEKTEELVNAAREKGSLLMVCHVLRHTPFYKQIKAVIGQGMIGQVQAIHHIENIGNWHFAHSFVRGNWNNSEESSPMIVAKCSHDTDIINFLLEGLKCVKISSFGSLGYFKKENMPEGATKNCMEGCRYNKECQFSAYKYLDDRKDRQIFRDIIMRTEDTGEFLDFLKDSPYSRCVYQCDNNVADHQVVNMEYENGVTVSFTASAFTEDILRKTKIMGTKGEIEGCLEDNSFVVKEFASGNITTFQVHTPKTLHSGGDECIMESFSHAIREGGKEDGKYSAQLSLQGHMMAYAAEESRVSGGNVIKLA